METCSGMATVHLISGLPCSGKTTYAAPLKADTGGVHFSLDYWLITTFGTYAIAGVGHEEHVRRVLVCRQLIWHAAIESLRGDMDVILDDGFFLREDRVHVITQAHRLGARAKMHLLSAPLDVLQARIASRNAKLPTYNFTISPDMLQAFVELFEVPTVREGAELVVVGE